jgi:hypothetical protein
METTSEHASQSLLAERRLQELAIHLPVPPEPFGTYTEAVQVGSLLFLSGTLPTEGRTAKFVGRVGAELDTATGREAARLAAMNAVANRSPASRLVGSRQTNCSPRRERGYGRKCSRAAEGRGRSV